MSTSSRFWAHWTTRDFAKAQASGRLAQTIAILPVAATEQHGPHLPLNVDSALVDGVVAAALPHIAADVPALFLPTQTTGLSPEHAAFAGTLTLSAETTLRLWTELAESVAASGVKKLVLLNSHGGQVGLMDVVARDLRARLGMLVYSVNWFGLPLLASDGSDVNALFSAHEHRFGIHAGEIETSMMLALSPALVHMELAQNFASTSEDRSKAFAILGNGKSAKLGWQMQDYNAVGAVGNAAAATAEKGHALLDAAGRALAQLLGELHQLPLSTLANAPQA
ncbi:creatininase [Rhodoferax lacus]|uniref:Creatininase n=1 Tax=Rhodoferax lacus TaxID=2184758 RepID=A0A3E1R6F2_9BURK|nr:creatininase family protein [Rhodoferax lacus]RFO94949.1 creatininase [Rhodoferax lacus]